jgi:RNA-binding motif X-linked protein 2
MNVIKEIERITASELEAGIFGGLSKGSWHEKYKDSAWVYVGGLPFELTEGDVICVMSQWGEIDDINLVRNKESNKSNGFAFVKYEDQRSTILAVDNFNGITLLNRRLRVDHVDQYRLPKHIRKKEEELLEINPEAEVVIGAGHAYKDQALASEFNINKGIDLWNQSTSQNALTSQNHTNDGNDDKMNKAKKKDKDKSHKHKKEKQKKHKDKTVEDKVQNIQDSRISFEQERSRESISNINRDARDRSRDRINRDDARTKDSQSRYFANSDKLGTSKQPVTQADMSTLIHPGNTDAPVASWRGKRDPALAHRFEFKGKKQDEVPFEQRKRDEFDGFGGMKRLR